MTPPDLVQAWSHYLISEEGRSPATVKEYLKDVRLLQAWLDERTPPPANHLRNWEDVGIADLRSFLAEFRPAPRRNHRLVSSWRSFWRFLRDVQKLPGLQNGPEELK